MVAGDDDFIEITDLDAPTALGIAGSTLNRAADIAEKMNDVQAMMKVAAGWMEVYELLSGHHPHDQPKKLPIGFASTRELDDAIGESVEPDDDGDDYDDEEYATEGDD